MNNIFKLSDDGKIFIKVLDKTAEHITIPYGVEVIEKRAFRQCSSLQSVNIPNSVTTIREGAFGSCEALQSIDIPDSVTTIEREAFIFCSAMLSVNIPNSVTTIGDMAFARCEALQSIDIPASVEDIGKNAFDGCEELQGINVASENQFFTSIGGVLYSKDLTKLVKVPAEAILKTFSIPDNVTTIARGAFMDCSSLQSIDIPASVVEIGWYEFAHCTKLQSINVAEENQHYTSIDGVLYNKMLTTLIRVPQGAEFEEFRIPDSVTTIEVSAFSDCSSLQSVYIPEGVTTIEMEAFEGCSSLQSIDIPASVKHIGTAAFSSCDALQSVHMHSTDVEERYSTYGVFDNEETGELTLYVPAGTIDAYRDRPMFSWFCNIEEE